jgi:hypothetical protein
VKEEPQSQAQPAGILGNPPKHGAGMCAPSARDNPVQQEGAAQKQGSAGASASQKAAAEPKWVSKRKPLDKWVQRKGADARAADAEFDVWPATGTTKAAQRPALPRMRSEPSEAIPAAATGGAVGAPSRRASEPATGAATEEPVPGQRAGDVGTSTRQPLAPMPVEQQQQQRRVAAQEPAAQEKRAHQQQKQGEPGYKYTGEQGICVECWCLSAWQPYPL